MGFSVFESMKIGLASPEQIRAWSHGEVQRPETINYRSQKPEKFGLFCERIFGPQKDWECNCGKYKRIRFKGKICEKCGVEVTKSKVRRERMGHIELAAPVSHIWYYKGTPSRIGQVLDLTPKKLEEVLYFTRYIVIDPGEKTGLVKKQLLTEEEYSQYKSKFAGIDTFRAGMGAEAVKELLAEIDLDDLADELKAELETTSAGQKQVKLLRRLDVIEAFRSSGNRPEWMILDCIPVIPPDIRPMVQLDGGRYATSDLNELYRKVVMRNNRLKDLLSKKAPDLIVRNEKRMLQEAVDALIDNGRHGRAYTGSNNRPLKSLSDMLKGKQGRFRQNLLGKRVDYSGRSVIVVGPELKMDQCGLPKEMALELFKPFVLRDLSKNGTTNIKQAKKKVERADDEVWDSLENVIKDHPVLLNRAPTLHRLGIQAFAPILVEGRAIKLHPLCCTAFNADFDGDQMAVHLPLSEEAQDEARNLMLAAKNLLKPSDGKPVTVPTQDMVLGSYYLTIDKVGEKGEGKVFRDANEAIMAYQDGVITIHAAIKVRVTKDLGDGVITRIVPTTVGKIIFNEQIPQDLGYVDRTDPDHQLDYEIGFKVGKKQLGKIIDRCLKIHGTATTAGVLDKIKAMGYKYSTKSGITVAVCDAEIPPQKADILAETDAAVAKINDQFRDGFLSDSERRKLFMDAWDSATKRVSAALTANLDQYNNIFMMADSGARGSEAQMRQLAGMRGLVANTSGETIEMPIKANYREGLNVLEYFISSRGARKGLADTALRTADSGYLTRRLVDVAQEVIIRGDDCGTENGIEVYEIRDGDRTIETLAVRLVGRFLTDDFIAPDGSFTISKDKMLTDADADRIVNSGVKRVKVRSVMTCELRNGVCAKCYGMSLANGQLINRGEAVGTIAAQSIGEPGTQLTMRNFHTGGVANAGGDITQGLPRVEELFESRHPKNAAIITKVSGTVKFEEIKKTRHAVITTDDGIEEAYAVPFGYRPKVQDGDRVEAGDPLTEGSINPPDILAVKGEKAVQDYIISEVQKPYQLQGVDINDKHIEVIVRQMMRKVRVLDAGDSKLLAGAVVGKNEYAEAIDELKAREEQGETVVYPTSEPVLLGITKASLATDSFMSAASFQETTRVLTEAAMRGKVDPLTGLKENIIIGKLIPAGTGLIAQEEAAAEKAAAEAAEASAEETGEQAAE